MCLQEFCAGERATNFQLCAVRLAPSLELGVASQQTMCDCIAARAGMLQQGSTTGTAVPGAEFSAVRKLAEHLELTPEQVGDWLQHCRDIPPQVLLSWICLWDLKRR